MDIKNILFTFDYELFLGEKSGSVQNCLIKPTKLLLDVFSRYDVSNLVFFVDTTYLNQLKNCSYTAAQKDYELIVDQLKQISKLGHYIFPHVHPHWLDANYSEDLNQWELKGFSKYRFHNIDKTTREKLFLDSINILKEILGNEIKIDGYRAGGWCIQPFSDFKESFEKFGLKYEFSVLPGEKNHNPIQYYDFTNLKNKTIYKFNDDITIEDRNGSFTEYCISNIKIPSTNQFLNRVLLKYLWKTGNINFGDGNGAIVNNGAINRASKEMISIELLTKVRLPLYKRFINEHSYMQFISHPKMVSNHNLKQLDAFLKFVKAKCQINSDFKLIKL